MHTFLYIVYAKSYKIHPPVEPTL